MILIDSERKAKMRIAINFKFDMDKALAAAIYIATKRPTELTQAKLFKMMYLSDKDHLVRYGRPITGDSYSAMEHGPVPSNLYNAFKEIVKGKSSLSKNAKILMKGIRLDKTYQYPRIEALSAIDPAQLSVSDMKSLDRIIEQFGQMTFSQVRQIAHDTPAWELAWNRKPKEKDAEPMDFREFFEDDANALAGVREEMIENDSLRKHFEGL
jgi:uncharacterized phage-associated protein